MKSVGIVCEYNPLHTGHVHQINYVKGMGAENVICVMSGNYTQRGEMAIADKYTRAKCAILSGADAVLELPFPYSSMSAEFFSRAAVHILGNMGVDTISFGHECKDISSLYTAADIFANEEFKSIIKNNTCGTAKSFFETYESFSNQKYTLQSNDILGAYYISAVNELFPNINILPLLRDGADYNSKVLNNDKHPSATAIREIIKNSNAYDGLIPNTAVDILENAKNDGVFPVDIENVSQSILSFFRMMTKDDIKMRAISNSLGGQGILDDQGIVNRICENSFKAKSVHELLSMSYTKNYTNARVNRVLLFSLFGVSDIAKTILPQSVTLLAASKKGCNYLSNIRKSKGIEILTKPSKASNDKLDNPKKLSDIMYSNAMNKNSDPCIFLRSSPYIEK